MSVPAYDDARKKSAVDEQRPVLRRETFLIRKVSRARARTHTHVHARAPLIRKTAVQNSRRDRATSVPLIKDSG